jgi:hypothetical protein
MECQYCKTILKTNSALKHHQTKTKYCLKLQGKDEEKGNFICRGCDKDFHQKIHLSNHIKICEYYKPENFLKRIDILENEKNILLQEKNILIQEKKDLIEIVFKNHSLKENIIIEIDEDEEDTSDDNKDNEEYKLRPLELGEGYTIEHRDEDGFVNVTNLCKAGNKQYKHWFSLDKTKTFLQVLSESVGFPTNTLIKYNTGSNKERATWAHPQVAINIAQWISPRFDVKVSAWVYEVMMTGKVDISNTKSYRQLQSENKDHKLKIQYLTKKYVKRQPRIDYKERNVVYILTTANMKKERRYVLGKAENLTNRLSVYNKSDEHEVIYYQECPDEEKMNIVETMVFNKLKEYREQANRERFILPKDKDIKYFKETIKKVIEFVN